MPGPKSVDLTDRVFGKLTALKRIGSTGSRGGALWLCRCDCGREKDVPAINLTRTLRPVRSCGAKAHVVETRHRTHGRTKSPEYGIWRQMVARCTKPDSQGYPKYGARGITVCDRWENSFENFLADMGDRPSADLTLERKDNNGPYSPTNCVWATRSTQQRNKRDTVRMTLNGVTKSVAEWAEQLGVKKHSLVTRKRYGWSDERILTTPIAKTSRVY